MNNEQSVIILQDEVKELSTGTKDLPGVSNAAAVHKLEVAGALRRVVETRVKTETSDLNKSRFDSILNGEHKQEPVEDTPGLPTDSVPVEAASVQQPVTNINDYKTVTPPEEVEEVKPNKGVDLAEATELANDLNETNQVTNPNITEEPEQKTFGNIEPQEPKVDIMKPEVAPVTDIPKPQGLDAFAPSASEPQGLSPFGADPMTAFSEPNLNIETASEQPKFTAGINTVPETEKQEDNTPVYNFDGIETTKEVESKLEDMKAPEVENEIDNSKAVIDLNEHKETKETEIISDEKSPLLVENMIDFSALKESLKTTEKVIRDIEQEVAKKITKLSYLEGLEKENRDLKDRLMMAENQLEDGVKNTSISDEAAFKKGYEQGKEEGVKEGVLKTVDAIAVSANSAIKPNVQQTPDIEPAKDASTDKSAAQGVQRTMATPFGSSESKPDIPKSTDSYSAYQQAS